MAEFREDDFINAITGLGVVGRDKRLSTSFCGEEVDPTTAENIWRGTAMGGRIVEAYVSEMFREGWEFKASVEYGAPDTGAASAQRSDSAYQRWRARRARRDAAPPMPPPGFPPPAPKAKPGPVMQPDDSAQQALEGLEAYFDDLHVKERFRSGCENARAIGGGAVIVGANDGSTNWELPLDEASISSIEFLTTLSKREIRAYAYYNDARSAKYGEVELWEVTPQQLNGSPGKGFPDSYFRIHESRVIPFRGRVTSPLQLARAQGLGDSIFTRVLNVLRDHEVTWGNTATLMTDFAQAVFRMQGLKEALAADKKKLVRDRVSAIDYARSTIRAAVIDKDDEFQRIATPLTGLPDLLDRFASRLASVADMPLTLLMGTSPGGLNATGDSDIRFFYDRVAAEQDRVLRPALERLARLAFAAKDGPTSGQEPDHWCVEFKPLWQMDEQQKAQLRLTQAQIDDTYVKGGVLTPEEVAASRFGGADWSWETHLDTGTRDAVGEAQAELEANPPPPVAAPPAKP
jgi:phage-related protein (TIGR01555 family)